jgi:hypothetical protein
VLTLALGATAAHAGKTKRFATTAAIEEANSGPEGLTFAGHVSSAKERCIKGRSVELRYEGDVSPEPFSVGTAKTESDGSWAITSNALLPAGDGYVLTVERKKIKRKHHRKLICKAGESPSFSLQ